MALVSVSTMVISVNQSRTLMVGIVDKKSETGDELRAWEMTGPPW